MAIQGLSPRVRGNHWATIVAFGNQRSIPACAGEPDLSVLMECQPRVYPRVCGGTVSAIRSRWLLLGLSPRVRGNPGGKGRVGGL